MKESVVMQAENITKELRKRVRRFSEGKEKRRKRRAVEEDGGTEVGRRGRRGGWRGMRE